jgi:hypothetical protein
LETFNFLTDGFDAHIRESAAQGFATLLENPQPRLSFIYKSTQAPVKRHGLKTHWPLEGGFHESAAL